MSLLVYIQKRAKLPLLKEPTLPAAENHTRFFLIRLALGGVYDLIWLNRFGAFRYLGVWLGCFFSIVLQTNILLHSKTYEMKCEMPALDDMAPPLL